MHQVFAQELAIKATSKAEKAQGGKITSVRMTTSSSSSSRCCSAGVSSNKGSSSSEESDIVIRPSSLRFTQSVVKSVQLVIC